LAEEVDMKPRLRRLGRIPIPIASVHADGEIRLAGPEQKVIAQIKGERALAERTSWREVGWIIRAGSWVIIECKGDEIRARVVQV
jgi:hypothetical protein